MEAMADDGLPWLTMVVMADHGCHRQRLMASPTLDGRLRPKHAGRPPWATVIPYSTPGGNGGLPFSGRSGQYDAQCRGKGRFPSRIGREWGRLPQWGANRAHFRPELGGKEADCPVTGSKGDDSGCGRQQWQSTPVAGGNNPVHFRARWELWRSTPVADGSNRSQRPLPTATMAVQSGCRRQ